MQRSNTQENRKRHRKIEMNLERTVVMAFKIQFVHFCYNNYTLLINLIYIDKNKEKIKIKNLLTLEILRCLI